MLGNPSKSVANDQRHAFARPWRRALPSSRRSRCRKCVHAAEKMARRFHLFVGIACQRIVVEWRLDTGTSQGSQISQSAWSSSLTSASSSAKGKNGMRRVTYAGATDLDLSARCLRRAGPWLRRRPPVSVRLFIISLSRPHRVETTVPIVTSLPPISYPWHVPAIIHILHARHALFANMRPHSIPRSWCNSLIFLRDFSNY